MIRINWLGYGPRASISYVVLLDLARKGKAQNRENVTILKESYTLKTWE